MEIDKTNISELIKHGTADGYRAVTGFYGPRIFALAYDIIGNREDAEEETFFHIIGGGTMENTITHLR